MAPEPPPAPKAGGEWFPHIIRHQVVGDGTVLVTWALPGLTTATVRVPVSAWIDGEHARTGAFLGAFIAPLLPQLTRPNDDVAD